MLINGKLIECENKLDVFNPYNGDKVGSVSNCSLENVNSAVEAAKGAKKRAKDATPFKRYELLFNVYEGIKKRKEEFAKLITLESGKTIRETRVEIERSLQTLLFSAEEAKRIHGETLSADVTPIATGRSAFTIREPIGVIGAICPFNFPLNLVVHKVGPAIAGGNTIVIKPASQTPLIAYELGKVFLESDAIPGLINIVSGKGSVIGDAIVKSDINMVSLTGSVEVGKWVASQAGMKKISLELGGNGPFIVMDDADIDKAVGAAVDCSFGSAGQRCTAIKRILLHKKIAEDFISTFVEATEKLNVGNPMDENTDIGPLIDENAAVEIENRVNDAIKRGAELLVGGKRSNAFYWPTILDNMPLDALMIRSETFGPVAPIIRIDTIEEAIQIANDTPYGLQAGLFTDNLRNIKYAIKNIETGALIINGPPGFRVETLPFGGVKNSGLGREGIKYAIQEMTEIKTIVY
jgi:lactaldehyde dehydrogenase